MKIDILSDLHLDFYFRAGLTITTKNVKSLFDDIFKKDTNDKMAEVLIIAGDLGHYNEQNIEVLKIIQKEYYKHIICVLGNHDYYLLNYDLKQQYNFNSFNRAKQMRDLINNESNMFCLDGDVINIFGHCKFDEVLIGKNYYGIDTSCVYGNKLTALQLGSMKIFEENVVKVDIK